MIKKITEKIFIYSQKIFFELLGPKFHPRIFRNLINYLYIMFEKIAYQFDFLLKYYLQLYKELVENEIDMAKVKSKDEVLVIGGGSIPATSIIIVKKTKSNVTTIDIDQKAINNSSIIIKKLNLENKMKLEYANGSNYDIKKFDVIFILYGVKNHLDILDSIGNQMKENARIIFRSVILENKKILGLNEKSLNFNIEKKIISQKLYPSASCLLLKK